MRECRHVHRELRLFLTGGVIRHDRIGERKSTHLDAAVLLGARVAASTGRFCRRAQRLRAGALLELRDVDEPAVGLDAPLLLVARLRVRLGRRDDLEMTRLLAEHLAALTGVGTGGADEHARARLRRIRVGGGRGRRVERQDGVRLRALVHLDGAPEIALRDDRGAAGQLDALPLAAGVDGGERFDAVRDVARDDFPLLGPGGLGRRFRRRDGRLRSGFRGWCGLGLDRRLFGVLRGDTSAERAKQPRHHQRRSPTSTVE